MTREVGEEEGPWTDLCLVHRRELLTGAGALGLAALPILACAQAAGGAGRDAARG